MLIRDRNYIYEYFLLPDGSSFDTVGNHNGLVYVSGEDCCSKPIARSVCSVDNFTDVLEFHDLLHGAKYLRK